MKPGDLVRKINDAQQVGVILDLRQDEQLNEEMARIKFGNGIQTLSLSEIEPFDGSENDMWSDLAALRLGRTRAFRTIMTFERLRRPPSPITSAFGTARARFYPYQFKPLLKFLENPEQRVLIADDVGLGKTIEAGYILLEWQARYSMNNVLIVVPARLRSKWQKELKQRFGETFDIVRAREIRQELQSVQKGKELSQFKWIASYETIRLPDLFQLFQDVRPTIDLLILDEAHRVRNRGTAQYRSAHALTDCADAIVFLSATPVQTGMDNLYTLLNLLEPDKYGTEQEFLRLLEANRPIVRACQFVSQGMLDQASEVMGTLGNNRLTRSLWNDEHFQVILDRLRVVPSTDRKALVKLQRDIGDFSLLGHVLNRTRKIEVMEEWPKRDPQSPAITLTDDELAIYDSVRVIIRLLNPEASGWGLSMAALTAFRYTASCIPAAAEYLEERLQAEGPLNLQREVDSDFIDDEIANEINVSNHNIYRQLSSTIKEILNRCPKDGQDSKFQVFVQAIQEIWMDDQDNNRPNRKIVVFAFFKRTLNYLNRELTKKFINNQLIHGDIPLDDREERIEYFLNSEDCSVLLSSEVGGEAGRAHEILSADLQLRVTGKKII
ncbi:DEAD/DEAH box helicase [Candidatus Parcubacteria bacterium]|nr:MAG: DEAD/DEAH box helicase [Candidatus Parcubacteria bacterium]